MTVATRTDRSLCCASCGRRRGPLEQRRGSWSNKQDLAQVPRREKSDTHDQPWEHPPNQLIVFASIYRNGGTDDTCHLCDDCLRIGLRQILLEVSSLLESISQDFDAHAEIARLMGELATAQHGKWTAETDRDSARYWAADERRHFLKLVGEVHAQAGNGAPAEVRHVLTPELRDRIQRVLAAASKSS